MHNQRLRSLVTYAWLSIAAAVLTIGLKAGAYWVTGSVGLLSDALESVVNLVTSFLVLTVLKIAALPPDESHPYGHEKAEYFSSGVEGTLILIAAATIIGMAVERFVHPVPIRKLDLGLSLSIVAALINLVVAQVLFRAARLNDSITLRADAQHLMSDVWTSVGVVTAIALVKFTGQQILDPLVGLAVSLHIGWVGTRLIYGSVHGLMDRALAAPEVQAIEKILESYRRRGVRYHALRTRKAGARRFVSLHVQVPGQWSVQQGHDLLESIEADIRSSLSSVTVLTHLEPLEDPVSWSDENLDRVELAGRKSE